MSATAALDAYLSQASGAGQTFPYTGLSHPSPRSSRDLPKPWAPSPPAPPASLATRGPWQHPTPALISRKTSDFAAISSGQLPLRLQGLPQPSNPSHQAKGLGSQTGSCPQGKPTTSGNSSIPIDAAAGHTPDEKRTPLVVGAGPPTSHNPQLGQMQTPPPKVPPSVKRRVPAPLPRVATLAGKLSGQPGPARCPRPSSGPAPPLVHQDLSTAALGAPPPLGASGVPEGGSRTGGRNQGTHCGLPRRVSGGGPPCWPPPPALASTRGGPLEEPQERKANQSFAASLRSGPGSAPVPRAQGKAPLPRGTGDRCPGPGGSAYCGAGNGVAETAADLITLVADDGFRSGLHLRDEGAGAGGGATERWAFFRPDESAGSQGEEGGTVASPSPRLAVQQVVPPASQTVLTHKDGTQPPTAPSAQEPSEESFSRAGSPQALPPRSTSDGLKPTCTLTGSKSPCTSPGFQSACGARASGTGPDGGPAALPRDQNRTALANPGADAVADAPDSRDLGSPFRASVSRGTTNWCLGDHRADSDLLYKGVWAPLGSRCSAVGLVPQLGTAEVVSQPGILEVGSFLGNGLAGSPIGTLAVGPLSGNERAGCQSGILGDPKNQAPSFSGNTWVGRQPDVLGPECHSGKAWHEWGAGHIMDDHMGRAMWGPPSLGTSHMETALEPCGTTTRHLGQGQESMLWRLPTVATATAEAAQEGMVAAAGASSGNTGYRLRDLALKPLAQKPAGPGGAGAGEASTLRRERDDGAGTPAKKARTTWAGASLQSLVHAKGAPSLRHRYPADFSSNGLGRSGGIARSGNQESCETAAGSLRGPQSHDVPDVLRELQSLRDSWAAFCGTRAFGAPPIPPAPPVPVPLPHRSPAALPQLGRSPARARTEGTATAGPLALRSPFGTHGGRAPQRTPSHTCASPPPLQASQDTPSGGPPFGRPTSLTGTGETRPGEADGGRSPGPRVAGTVGSRSPELAAPARAPGTAASDGWGPIRAAVGAKPLPRSRRRLVRVVVRVPRSSRGERAGGGLGTGVPDQDAVLPCKGPPLALPVQDEGRGSARPATAVPNQDAGGPLDLPVLALHEQDGRGPRPCPGPGGRQLADPGKTPCGGAAALPDQNIADSSRVPSLGGCVPPPAGYGGRPLDGAVPRGGMIPQDAEAWSPGGDPAMPAQASGALGGDCGPEGVARPAAGAGKKQTRPAVLQPSKAPTWAPCDSASRQALGGALRCVATENATAQEGDWVSPGEAGVREVPAGGTTGTANCGGGVGCPACWAEQPTHIACMGDACVRNSPNAGWSSCCTDGATETHHLHDLCPSHVRPAWLDKRELLGKWMSSSWGPWGTLRTDWRVRNPVRFRDGLLAVPPNYFLVPRQSFGQEAQGGWPAGLDGEKTAATSPWGSGPQEAPSRGTRRLNRPKFRRAPHARVPPKASMHQRAAARLSSTLRRVRVSDNHHMGAEHGSLPSSSDSDAPSPSSSASDLGDDSTAPSESSSSSAADEMLGAPGSPDSLIRLRTKPSGSGRTARSPGARRRRPSSGPRWKSPTRGAAGVDPRGVRRHGRGAEAGSPCPTDPIAWIRRGEADIPPRPGSLDPHSAARAPGHGIIPPLFRPCRGDAEPDGLLGGHMWGHRAGPSRRASRCGRPPESGGQAAAALSAGTAAGTAAGPDPVGCRPAWRGTQQGELWLQARGNRPGSSRVSEATSPSETAPWTRPHDNCAAMLEGIAHRFNSPHPAHIPGPVWSRGLSDFLQSLPESLGRENAGPGAGVQRGRDEPVGGGSPPLPPAGAPGDGEEREPEGSPCVAPGGSPLGEPGGIPLGQPGGNPHRELRCSPCGELGRSSHGKPRSSPCGGPGGSPRVVAAACPREEAEGSPRVVAAVCPCVEAGGSPRAVEPGSRRAEGPRARPRVGAGGSPHVEPGGIPHVEPGGIPRVEARDDGSCRHGLTDAHAGEKHGLKAGLLGNALDKRGREQFENLEDAPESRGLEEGLRQKEDWEVTLVEEPAAQNEGNEAKGVEATTPSLFGAAAMRARYPDLFAVSLDESGLSRAEDKSHLSAHVVMMA
eukprot:jgi/Botrbrau1/12294/Bobra.27_5s0005.1